MNQTTICAVGAFMTEPITEHLPSDIPVRRHTMHLWQEDLARAHRRQLLDEAEHQRLVNLARKARKARRVREARIRARRALARAMTF